jgi:hypothetical protein
MKPNEIAPKRQFASAKTRPRREGVALNNAVKRRAARDRTTPVSGALKRRVVTVDPASRIVHARVATELVIVNAWKRDE